MEVRREMEELGNILLSYWAIAVYEQQQEAYWWF